MGRSSATRRVVHRADHSTTDGCRMPGAVSSPVSSQRPASQDGRPAGSPAPHDERRDHDRHRHAPRRRPERARPGASREARHTRRHREALVEVRLRQDGPRVQLRRVHRHRGRADVLFRAGDLPGTRRGVLDLRAGRPRQRRHRCDSRRGRGRGARCGGCPAGAARAGVELVGDGFRARVRRTAGHLVRIRIRRRIQPRDEPHLRDRRGAPGLEAQARSTPHHPDRHRADRRGARDPRGVGSGRAGGRRRHRPGRRRHHGVGDRQVAGPRARRRSDGGDPLLRDAEREAAEVPLDQPGVAAGDPRPGRRVGRLRPLRGQLLELRPHLRLARRDHHLPAVAVDREHRPAVRRRVRRRARAGRQLQAGIAAEEDIQLPPRDTRKSDKAAEKERKDIEEGRRIREQHDDDADEQVSDAASDRDRSAGRTTS